MFLKILLNDSNLVIADELLVFDAVCRWLTNHEFDSSRAAHFEANCGDLLPFIRFSQMLEIQLFLIESSKFMRDSPACVQELLRKCLFKAYRFRCLEEVILKLNMSHQNEQHDHDLIASEKALIFEPNFKRMTSNAAEYEGFLTHMHHTQEKISATQKLYSFIISGDPAEVAGTNSTVSPSSDIQTSALSQDLIKKTLADSIKCEYLNTGHGVELFDHWYLPRNYTETCLGDALEIKPKQKVAMHNEISLFCGPSPKGARVEKWKISYKIVDTHCCSLRLIGDESVFAKRKSLKAQVVVILYDHKERVMQVDASPSAVFEMGLVFEKKIEFEKHNLVKKIVILIKQCLF